LALDLGRAPEEAFVYRLGYGLIFLLLLDGIAHARSATLLTWNDDSVNEEGFIVERTETGDCTDGWQVIAYTAANETFLMDVYIPGACYRVAAYNDIGTSHYSDTVRVPRDPFSCCVLPEL
jgi:hypothetical protein